MKKIQLILFCIMFFFTATSQEIQKIKIGELEGIIAQSKTPMIVNFWATWCKPCVEELPYFIKETEAYKNEKVKLLLVSLDFEEAYPDAINRFIAKRKISHQVVWLNETNADIFCPKIDAKWSGAIPASLFINHKTGYRKFFEEQLSHEELKSEMAALVKAH